MLLKTELKVAEHVLWSEPAHWVEKDGALGLLDFTLDDDRYLVSLGILDLGQYDGK